VTHAPSFQKISSKSVLNILHILLDKETDKQADRPQDITSVGEGKKEKTKKRQLTALNRINLSAKTITVAMAETTGQSQDVCKKFGQRINKIFI